MGEPTVGQLVGAHVSQDLIDRLKEAFPLRSPGLADPDRMIWFNAGRQDLIKFLEFARSEFITPQE